MFIPSDLLYLPLDLPIPPRRFLNCLLAVIDSFGNYSDEMSREVNVNDLYFDEYRNSGIIHLTDRNGAITPIVARLQEDNEMSVWFDAMWEIFNPTRSAITCTYPGSVVPPHIDCSPSMFHTLQHKIRYMVRCDQQLDFLVSGNRTVSPALPWDDALFVFSGKWPHSMANTTNSSICILTMGAPWEASLNDSSYVELLQMSYDKYYSSYMSMADLQLPEKYFQYFEAKYL